MIKLSSSLVAHTIEQFDMYLVSIDGKKIKTLEELYDCLTELFRFPNYFGRNLDALEEMLNDLNWIHQTAILLLIQNANFMLFSEPVEIRDQIMSIFEVVENSRLEIITCHN